MPNSTNQPSTSDLPETATAEADETISPQAQKPPSNGNGNVRVLIDVEDDALPPDASTTEPEPTPPHALSDPVPPSEVRSRAMVLADGTPVQPPPPPRKARPEADLDGLPSAQERAPARRSLRMQIRFTRAVLWAAGLLIRILYWEWLVKRGMGEKFVQAHSVQRWKAYARDFRKLAADMGGVFIKAGQFFSTRADIFPEEIIMELAGLQDEIPAVDFKQIEKVIIAELGEDYEQQFTWLRKEPIAAASLGQVHRAKLANGDRVVIKVQRPGIVRIIDTDMASLLLISRVAMRFKFISRRANAVEITEEFGRVLWEEVSYRKEAQNAQAFARMFQDDMTIYIPMVYDELSTDRLLVMEDVTSIKINDYERLEAAGINRNEIANRLMDSYLRQVFDKRFFHADPHPGNLFVYPLPVEDENADFGPKGRPFYLIYIDFGMTGTLTPQIIDGLVSTLIAVINRDARGLIASYRELDLLLPSADMDRLEAATKAAFDQVWGMDMQDLTNVDYEVMEQLGEEFNDLLFDMPFQMPQNFIYLARTMGILSGMCTSLDPRFNPWMALQPFTEKMMRMRASDGASVGGTLIGNIFGSGNLFEAGSRILTRAVAPGATSNSDLMRELRSGDIRVTTEPSRKWRIQMRFLEIYIQIATRAVLFTGFLISSTLLLVNDYTWFAAGGYVLCVMIAWRIIFPPNLLQ